MSGWAHRCCYERLRFTFLAMQKQLIAAWLRDAPLNSVSFAEMCRALSDMIEPRSDSRLRQRHTVMQVMKDRDNGDVTRILHQVNAGAPGAADALYARLYPELMRLARTHVSRIGTVSIDSSTLLHEAYLRLVRQDGLPTVSRNAFFGYASKVMRSVVVDYVRERSAQKRGGAAQPVTLVTDFADVGANEESVESIHEALTALKAIDPRAHDVVEMRYFGGLSEHEVADVLAVSEQTVQRDWRKARAFLLDFMR